MRNRDFTLGNKVVTPWLPSQVQNFLNSFRFATPASHFLTPYATYLFLIPNIFSSTEETTTGALAMPTSASDGTAMVHSVTSAKARAALSR